MVVEYKIRFVEGGVNVTQIVTSEPRKPLTTTTKEQENLGPEFTLTGTRPPVAPPGLTMGASATSAGGEVTPSTTGGGGPYGTGLTIVFGSVHAAGPVSSLGSGEPSPSSTGGGEVSSSTTGGVDTN